MNKRICIIGSSGFAKEVYLLLLEAGYENQIDCFMEPEKYWQDRLVFNIPVKKQSEFDPKVNSAVIGIGDPKIRHRVVYEELPKETEYPIILHPSLKVSKWNNIARGSIITIGNVITCDISIGEFAAINPNCTIGHETVIGNFLTSNAGVNVSGNCNIGNFVYLGTNAAIKQGLTISDNVIVGMGSIVVKNISESGTYVGNPARRLLK
jgi:sugar O-acyltransferase (sialic acid O-acetyltransferase NeuD family)